MPLDEPFEERLEIDTEDWPVCAKCSMSVEDFYLLITNECICLVAECHKQTQRVDLNRILWNNADLSSVETSYAFQDT